MAYNNKTKTNNKIQLKEIMFIYICQTECK